MIRKTGKDKLSNYVEGLRDKLMAKGSRKRISINTLIKVSGLSRKSITMYASWNNWGSISGNALVFTKPLRLMYI